VEADDVIGTLAMKASSHGISTLIASTDKDFNQLLVNPALQLYHPIKKEYRDANWVKDTFGINADQFVDWLALVGDSSDGIPGITDVGPDTASKWLQKYHNIDTLLVRANEIKGKRGENLRSEMTRLRLMRRIATIHTSLELGVTLRNFRLPDGFY
jgi:DNA polymerase-1